MARRASWSYLTPHLLKRLFRRRETIRYPIGPVELPATYRGQVAVDIAACIGCGSCQRICPTGAIRVERTDDQGVRVQMSFDLCASCGLCAAACPRTAIRMLPSFAPSATSRSQLQTEWRRSGRPRTERESDTE